MKKLYLQAVQRLLTNKRGFTLVEVLLGCFLIVMVVGIILPNISSFNKNIDMFRAKNIAYMLATDIRRVHVIDMYRGNGLYKVIVDERANQYYISSGAKILELQDINKHLDDSWRINAANKDTVFYMRGSVAAYNYINIVKRADILKGYQIQVLPVTGRIGVYKK